MCVAVEMPHFCLLNHRSQAKEINPFSNVSKIYARPPLRLSPARRLYIFDSVCFRSLCGHCKTLLPWLLFRTAFSKAVRCLCWRPSAVHWSFLLCLVFLFSLKTVYRTLHGRIALKTQHWGTFCRPTSIGVLVKALALRRANCVQSPAVSDHSVGPCSE